MSAPLTMTAEQERALRGIERAEYNYPVAEVWAELDATRARLAEALRDARDTHPRLAALVQEQVVALAASSAREAQMRAALELVRLKAVITDLNDFVDVMEAVNAVLSRAPQSDEALRALLLSFADDVAIEHEKGLRHLPALTNEQLVARLLERSDDAQGQPATPRQEGGGDVG